MKKFVLLYVYMFLMVPNEFSRIEFRESIGESEGGGKDGVY